MQCLEFRRRILTEPNCVDGDTTAHAAECPACRRFAERQQAFERELKVACTVEVPEGLCHRVLLQQRLVHRRRLRRIWQAVLVAASLLLAVSASVLVMPAGLTGHVDQLGVAAIEHVAAEPDLLAHAEPVPLGLVNAALMPIGARFVDRIGEVRYAGPCAFKNHMGGHLVLGGTTGPVTILLLPKEPLAKPVTVRKLGWQGMVLPASRGSVALIARPGEDLTSLTEQVRRALVYH